MKAKLRKWTQKEIDLLTREWRTKKALGFSSPKIVRELMPKLNRSFQSIISKAEYLNLTFKSSALAHEYQQSALAESYQQLKPKQRQQAT